MMATKPWHHFLVSILAGVVCQYASAQSSGNNGLVSTVVVSGDVPPVAQFSQPSGEGALVSEVNRQIEEAKQQLNSAVAPVPATTPAAAAVVSPTASAPASQIPATTGSVGFTGTQKVPSTVNPEQKIQPLQYATPNFPATGVPSPSPAPQFPTIGSPVGESTFATPNSPMTYGVPNNGVPTMGVPGTGVPTPAYSAPSIGDPSLASPNAYMASPPFPQLGGVQPGAGMSVMNASPTFTPSYIAPALSAATPSVFDMGAACPPAAPVAVAPAASCAPRPARHCRVCLDPCCRSICGCDPCRSRFWAHSELMMAWISGYETPSLVTTSPAGTPASSIGVLGQPGTRTLLGGTNFGEEIRLGARVTAGWWFDDCRKIGLQTEFFALGNGDGNGDDFRYSSDGDPSLARPFFNTDTGAQDSQLLAVPGLARGTIAFDTSSQIYSAAPSLRFNVCCLSTPCACSEIQRRTDFLIGYRYFQINEAFRAKEVLTPTNGLYPAGTRFELTDNIRTENEFHGIELGGDWMWQSGRLTWGLASKVALGQVERRVILDGSTRVVTPGILDETTPGGFYVRPENVGRYRDRDFAAIPQLRANIGYCVHRNVRVTAGYTFMYLSSAFRPSSFLQPTFAGSSLGDPAIIGTDPTFSPARQDVFLHGLTVGLLFNF